MQRLIPSRSLPLGQQQHPMAGYYLEVLAKLFIRSDSPAEEIPGDIYSQIAEHVRSDEDIIDIEVQCVPVPEDLCGPTPH